MPYRHEINTADPFKISPRAVSIEVADVVIPPPPGYEPPAIPVYEAPLPTVMRTMDAETIDLEKMIYERSFQRALDVFVYLCRCQRCPKTWYTLQQTPPKTCPGCRSPWWNRPYKAGNHPIEVARAEPKKKKKKAKRGPIIPGRGRGRPRKYAIEEVPTEWAAKAQAEREASLPEVPMELLGAVDQPANPPSPGYGGAAAADDENFPVPTPFDSRPPVPDVPVALAYSPVQTGQPADGGNRSPVADPRGYTVGADLTLKPEPPPAPQITTGVEPPPMPEDWDDDWHPS